MPNLSFIIISGILLVAGIGLTVIKKIHIFYFIISAVFLVCLGLYMHYFHLGNSYDKSTEETRENLLLALKVLVPVVALLSFVNLGRIKEKTGSTIILALSIVMIVFCITLFVIYRIYIFLDDMPHK